ncbi:siphovirus ReqiPepy6 Gp37-like family protein [Paraliobacillus sediminis]|uniref:siphovirus ReqiPepy6 Gp37-like family protein n=1 Tax=Paraliobacillus sediminis TaxID=1885916 RepID=UPI000E3DEA0F|nr:siphovirus ReqiPepy6 Gp37-like family protein [Paraliobacillus sediminis]
MNKMPIRIYSPYLDLLHETDNYISLQYGPKFYEVGTFELHINQYTEGSEYFQKGNVIVIDKQGEKSMLIRHREIGLDENGKSSENWKIIGVTLEGVTDQRITVPPINDSHDRKSGPAETVMKHYIARHFVNPSDPNRKMRNIEIAPDLERGWHISYESRLKPISEELTTIGKRGNLGWIMYADLNAKKWIFDVVETRDLTQDNPFGNTPIYFSPDFATIKNQNFVDSNSGFKNVSYVGGQGEGTERKILSVGEAAGIDRLEVFVDANDIGNGSDSDSEDNAESEEGKLTDEEIEELLIERGMQKLEEDFNTNFYLEAQILTPIWDARTNQLTLSTAFEYGKDFRLGDMVTVLNKKWNIMMNAPITEFVEIHEAGGFILEAVFGEARPTLISKIKREFDKINGIDKQELPSRLQAKALNISKELITAEEQARIDQAKANLQTSKEFTTNYAEKKRVESDTEPEEKDLIWVDTSDPDNVIWKIWSDIDLVWKVGPSGPQGPAGPQGIEGSKGEDGQPTYTWVRYADSDTGENMSNFPDNKAYIGFSYNRSTAVESTEPTDYTWSLIKGEKGDQGDQGPQGVEGPEGADGQPTYTWIRYAEDSSGTNMSNFSDGMTHIGIAANKTTATESTEPTDYNWALIKGDKGTDGLSAYTHIAYANSSTGNGFSIDPTSKQYIGMYTSNSETQSTDPSLYKWSLIKGADGSQGVQGPSGENGQTPYFHTAYATNSTGTSGFSTTVSAGKTYIGTYTDFTSADSTDPSKYKWVLIKGDKGDVGSTGPQGPNIVDSNTSYGSGYDPTTKETPSGAQNKANAAQSNAEEYSRARFDPSKDLVANWRYSNTVEIDGGSVRAQTLTTNHISTASLSAIRAVFKSSIDSNNYTTVENNMIHSEGIYYSAWAKKNQKGVFHIDDGRITMKSGETNLSVYGQTEISKFGVAVEHYMNSGSTKSGGTFIGTGAIGFDDWYDGDGVTGSIYSSGNDLSLDAKGDVVVHSTVFRNNSGDYRIEARSGYVALASQNHYVYLQTGNTEVRVTDWMSGSNYKDIRAKNYVSGNNDTLFQSGKSAMLESLTNQVYARSNDELRVVAPGTYSSYKPVRASSHPTSSSREYKDNITGFSLYDAHMLIDNTEIYRYHIKTNVDAGIYDKPKIGMMNEEVPQELRDEDGVDTYSITSVLWKITQEHRAEIKELKQLVNDLVEAI